MKILSRVLTFAGLVSVVVFTILFPATLTTSIFT